MAEPDDEPSKHAAPDFGFGARLRAARRAKKMSGTDLGEVLGVGKQVVSGWETGRHYPKADQLYLLCKRLSVSADDLMFGSPRLELSGLAHDLAKQAEELPESERERLAAVLSSKKRGLPGNQFGVFPDEQKPARGKARGAS